MCGKNCNSERQWQGHISSEKHKEKVFHTEDDQNCWQHRFPTGYFSICDRWVTQTPEWACRCQWFPNSFALGPTSKTHTLFLFQQIYGWYLCRGQQL